MEVEGLLFSPKNSQLVHIFSFHSQGVVSLFIFPTGQIALGFPDPTHQTRAPWLGPLKLKTAKSNFFKNRNILQTLKNEPLNIMLLHTSRRMECPLLLANGPSHGAQVWCLGRVLKHRNQWQEVEGSGKKQRACYLAPNTLSCCIF